MTFTWSSAADSGLAVRRTETLRGCLANSGRYFVKSQQQMLTAIRDSILHDDALRKRYEHLLTGSVRQDTSLKNLARIVGIDYMLYGRLNRTEEGAREIAVTVVNPFYGTTSFHEERNYDSEISLRDHIIPAIVNNIAPRLRTRIHLTRLIADARVEVDNVERDWRRNASVSLSPGIHTICAHRAGFLSTCRTLHVRSQQDTVELNMPPLNASGAFFRSVFIPGLGQRYSGRHDAKWFWWIAEGLAAGGTATAIYWNRKQNRDSDSNNEYEKAQETYKKARDYYLSLGHDGNIVTQSQFDNARNDMIEKKNDMNQRWDNLTKVRTYVCVAAGIWAGMHVANVLDSVINFPDVNAPMVSFGPVPSADPENSRDAVGIVIQLALTEGRK